MPEGAPAAAAEDLAARQRIAEDLDTTLFVEAGAGSGKTTNLVTRVVALVTDGVELANIAAITFTDKAGAELRDRVRRQLEVQVEAGGGDPVVIQRCRVALDQLDGAAIGTLHSVAQRLLSEHPVEAGLPPRVEVLDEVSSSVAFERRWSVFLDELLENPELERTLLLFLASGVKHEALRSLAEAFDDNWDLVDEQVPECQPDPPNVAEVLTPVLYLIDELCLQPCRDPSDKLRLPLDEIAMRVKELRTIDDELDLLDAISTDVSPKWP